MSTSSVPLPGGGGVGGVCPPFPPLIEILSCGDSKVRPVTQANDLEPVMSKTIVSSENYRRL